MATFFDDQPCPLAEGKRTLLGKQRRRRRASRRRPRRRMGRGRRKQQARARTLAGMMTWRSPRPRPRPRPKAKAKRRTSGQQQRLHNHRKSLKKAMWRSTAGPVILVRRLLVLMCIHHALRRERIAQRVLSVTMQRASLVARSVKECCWRRRRGGGRGGRRRPPRLGPTDPERVCQVVAAAGRFAT